MSLVVHLNSVRIGILLVYFLKGYSSSHDQVVLDIRQRC